MAGKHARSNKSREARYKSHDSKLEQNKKRRADKVKRTKAEWIKKGVKKNGKKVRVSKVR